MTTSAAGCLEDLFAWDVPGPDCCRSRCHFENVGGEIFGGQYLGQSLWAAMATADGFVPQTMFGNFQRSAAAGVPLDFEVVRARQGRRFAHRQVIARQAGKDVFRAEVSLCKPDFRHPEHQRPMPAAPDPRSLKSLKTLARERRDWLGERAVATLLKERFFETFPVRPDIGMGQAADRPYGLYWVKPAIGTAVAAASDYAVLAYLSDIMANMASRMMYVTNAYDDSLSSLSLNHGVWFHRPPRLDGWLLFEVESHFAAGGIGSNRGLIFGEDGLLYASFVQDALVSFPDAEPG